MLDEPTLPAYEANGSLRANMPLWNVPYYTFHIIDGPFRGVRFNFEQIKLDANDLQFTYNIIESPANLEIPDIKTFERTLGLILRHVLKLIF